MDLKTLMGRSPKVLTVIEAIKSDPQFLEELKTNPEVALKKIGVDLDEEELALVQKYEYVCGYKDQALGIIDKFKSLFGTKNVH